MKSKKGFRIYYFRHILLAIVLVLWSSGALLGQKAYLEVTKGVSPKIRISISLNEKEVARILTADLKRNGYFEITSPEQAELLLKGKSRPVKGGIAVELRLFTIDPPASFYSLKGKNRDRRKLAHDLADRLVKELIGRKGIALTRIAAVYQVGKKKEIVLLDYDGANESMLTSDRALNLFPRFSRDNSSLLYTSYARYWPEIVLHSLRSGKREVVASYPGLNSAPSFAPDGRRILLTLSKDGNPEIYLLTLRGRKLQRITRSSAIDTSPVFMPDGKNIIFVSDRSGSPQLYRLNLENKSIRRLTLSGSYNTSPSLSPSGAYLAYTSRVKGRMEILLLELESGSTFCLTSGPGNKEDPSFAPDGRHLVFTLTRNHTSNLYMLDIFTREIYPVTTKGGYTTPTWSN